MRLNHPPRRPLRVHELAKELGWPSSELLRELSRRGEFVKSAASTVPEPVARDIRRDFPFSSADAGTEETVPASQYGNSAQPPTSAGRDETFGAALARVKAHSSQRVSRQRAQEWRPAILQALVDQVVAERTDVPGEPRHWEIKEAKRRQKPWAEAQLSGLGDDESTILQWIHVCNGKNAHLAAELSRAGITPHEAGLRLGYSGRVDPRMDTLFSRFRDCRINRSELIAAVRQWQQKNEAC